MMGKATPNGEERDAQYYRRMIDQRPVFGPGLAAIVVFIIRRQERKETIQQEVLHRWCIANHRGGVPKHVVERLASCTADKLPRGVGEQQ